MKTKAITTVLVASVCVAMLFTETSSWRRRRRRRRSPPPPPPPCYPQDCTIRWSDWSGCSSPCGNSGVRTRQRIIITWQNSCGSCPYAAQETEACNRDASLCLHGSTPASNGCTCRSGWTGTCCGDDINECLTSPCAHRCHNNDGGFTCSCDSCYEKAGSRCELKQCKINGQCYSYNTINPSNQCQRCDSGHLMGWTNDDSLSCNDGIACTRNDYCSNSNCTGTPFTCLPCEECHSDTCRVKSGYCTIVEEGAKTCFSHGDLRQGYPCQQCDSNNQHQWTNNNNLPCSDNNLQTKDDRCMNGVCTGTSYKCLSCQAHDGSGCQLQPGYCIIDQGDNQTCFATNQLKPGNPCQWCDPGGSSSTWTNREGVACNDGDHCTSGDTCTGGQCRATPFTCNSLCQYCNGSGCSLKTGFGFVNNKCTCKIAGQDYDHQTVNPSNQCQWCDLYDSAVRANSAWSNRPSVPCDDQNKCTKQDICSAGRYSQAYTRICSY